MLRTVFALTIAMATSMTTLVVGSDEGMSPDLMRSLKMSTVYVKTELGRMALS